MTMLTRAMLSRRLQADYRAVYATPAGRRVLDDLMKFGGLDRSSVQMEKPDLTLFFEGQRRVALRIAKLLSQSMHTTIDTLTTNLET